MWKACRKRAPVTELEPSSPTSSNASSSTTPPPPGPSPRHTCSPIQHTHTEAVPASPSPRIARARARVRARARRSRATAGNHNKFEADSESGQPIIKSCSHCKTSKSSSWRKIVIDRKKWTVCTACSIALLRARKQRSSSNAGDSTQRATVEPTSPLTTEPAHLPVELPPAQHTTSIARRNFQQDPGDPDVELSSNTGWQLSRTAAWLSSAEAKAENNTRHSGEDLAILAHGLEWLSTLLERVCAECSAEQISWLEHRLKHEWKVEEMTIFVHGFLAGIAATDSSMVVFSARR